MNQKLKDIGKRFGLIIIFPLIIIATIPLFFVITVAILGLSIPYFVITGKNLIDELRS